MTLTAKPTVQLVDVRRLRPWDRNPRTISTERFDALKRSLEHEPDHLRARPLVALPDGRVIAGNMRVRAAAALLDERSPRFLENFPLGRVPTFVADLDEGRAAAWAIRDNNEYGEWNEQELAEILYELEQAGADLDLTGFTQDRTTQLLDSVSGEQRPHNFPDDPAPNPPAKPKTKPGQLFELGPHRLMCGDATNPDAVARLLDDARPQLMVTDPPYGVGLDLGWRRGENRRKGGKVKTATPAGYGDAGPVAAPRRPADARRARGDIGADVRVDWAAAYELVSSIEVAYVWCADAYLDMVIGGLRRIGFNISQLVIWDKLQFVLSRAHYHWQHETGVYAAAVGAEVPWYGPVHTPGVYARKPKAPWLGSPDQSTVWQAPSPKRRAKTGDATEDPVDHPTQKPTLLYTKPYTNHTRRGDVVYEPFGGSGTALIAAEMTGRRAYVMELDPAFCDVIRTRYAEYTGDDRHMP